LRLLGNPVLAFGPQHESHRLRQLAAIQIHQHQVARQLLSHAALRVGGHFDQEQVVAGLAFQRTSNNPSGNWRGWTTSACAGRQFWILPTLASLSMESPWCWISHLLLLS
jgi:hypothetical protein